MIRWWLVILLLVSGCAKPDSVTEFKSPIDGLYYTVEEHRASGPTSDSSRVVAHLYRNGGSNRIVILEGENLVISTLRWDSPSQVTLCLNGGITSTFRNEVTLISGRDSVTVHNRLIESCGGDLATDGAE